MGRIRTSAWPWARRHPWWTAVIVVLVIGAVGSAVSPAAKRPPAAAAMLPTAHATASAAPTQTSPTPPPRPAIPQTEKDARSYIGTLGFEAGQAQASVEVVQIQIGELIQSPTPSNVNALALAAKQAHDLLNGIRADFAETTTEDGPLGNAQIEVFTAANDLKNAMGAIGTYVGDPNPQTLADLTVQYQQARAEWNQGIRVIWRAAREKNAPTI